MAASGQVPPEELDTGPTIPRQEPVAFIERRNQSVEKLPQPRD